MPADWTISSGDTSPLFFDELTYSNQQPVNLEGATVVFVMRSSSANTPVKLTGTVNFTSRAEGKLYYSPSVADSAVPGNYLAQWHVTFAGGEKQTFPTEGYLWVEVTPALTEESPGTIIGLPEVIDRLNIPNPDRIHDAKLTEWIAAVGPLIEDLTGPITPQVYDEWYAGGHTTISLRHRPNAGYGTTPILDVLAVIEYRGPIGYDLLNVPTPASGQVYSIMVNKELGYIARRTSGGGSMPFYSDGQSGQNVNIRYRSGQETCPQNVKMAAIEALKWWWDTTQPQGKGFMTAADQETSGRPMVALPYAAEAMLGPTRKAPSIA